MPKSITSKKRITKAAAVLTSLAIMLAAVCGKLMRRTSEDAGQYLVQGAVDTSGGATGAYYFSTAEDVFDVSGKRIGQIAAGSVYSAYRDPGYRGRLVIDYMYGRYLVSDAHAVLRRGSVLLATAAIGQMGGSIRGQGSCGPAAAAILAVWQRGLLWSKDELILYAEGERLNDQGSLREGGGMTAPMLTRLITGYSGGAVTASNIYSGKNTAQTLKEQIDRGNRAIVLCQYTGGEIVRHYHSGTHYIVVCGYEVADGELYFYYADPYYGDGGRSLRTVRADVLSHSADMVVREPRCIIILN